jgi:hypothetical protein
MDSCICSSTSIVLLAENVVLALTEVPGTIRINLYQCNKCGSLIAENVEQSEED